MKKSNKGFTLIELLASMVLLGIIFVFGIPVLTSMVTSNRDKIYVNDAKKLMSQAEYRIKASSTVIEKPNPGDCIVISMVYLDSTDFDEAPNRGEYVRDASYVVIKNNAGTLEYSAAIVEKLKDGSYKGIKLARESDLRGRNAIRFVGPISSNELIRVDDNLSVDYINDQVNGGESYVGNIYKIYNNPDLSDDASYGGQEPPMITKANMSSTSGKSYDSLDATLTITAEDKDAPKSELKVYISRTGYIEDLDSATGEPYGTGNSFTKNYEFDKSPYNIHYGDANSTVILYIVVADKQGNTDKTTIIYNIHMNEAPVINTKNTKFNKLDTDKVNRVQAKLRVEVTDDIDKPQNMTYCIVKKGGTCNAADFKSYSDTFDSNGEKLYKFSDNACNLNGQKEAVTIYVKDKDGKISEPFTAEYTIHKDEAPTFAAQNWIAVDSANEAFTNVGSLNVRIKVKGSDDVSYNSNMKVHISEANSQTKVFEFDPNKEMDYSMGGSYTGGSRTIKVKLEDECHHFSEEKSYNYPIYGNKPPVIEDLTVTTRGSACLADYPCNDALGGNRVANVNFSITDDIDYLDLRNKIDVCIGEYDSYCCASRDANGKCTALKNTKKYSEYEGGTTYTFAATSQKPYNGGNKDLYLFAKDSYGQIAEKKVNYKLYANQAPYVEDFSVQSEDTYFTSSGNLDVSIFMKAYDDLSEGTKLKYKVTSIDPRGVETDVLAANKTDKCAGTFEDYDELTGIRCYLGGNYDGTVRKVKLTVTDEYNKSNVVNLNNAEEKAVFNYTVYKNKAPRIIKMPKDAEGSGTGGESSSGNGDDISVTLVEDGADIVPKNSECSQNYKCPYLTDEGGSADVMLLFDIEDDIDQMPSIVSAEGEKDVYAYPEGEEGLKICAYETLKGAADPKKCDNPANYVSYATFLNDNRLFSFNAGTSDPYDGLVHTLYLNAMDSFGATNEKPITIDYQIYKNEAPRFYYKDDHEQEIKSVPSIHTRETNRYSLKEIDPDNTTGETTTPDTGGTSGSGELDLYEGLNNIRNAKFEIQAMDDFDEQINLQFKICYKTMNGTTVNNDEKCGAWQPYSADGYNVDFAETYANPYNGKTFQVYAYVRDSLGKVGTEKSDSVTYTLYKDVTPILHSISAVFLDGDELSTDDTEKPEEEKKCVESEGKYYGPNGELLADKDEYTLKCLTTDGNFYCVEYQGKYYGPTGEEIASEEEFNEQCISEPGDTPTQEEHICEKVGNKYYGPHGEDFGTDRQRYLNQCEGYTAPANVSVDDKHKVKFSIVVQDPYDTYKVCINKTGDECNAADYVGLANGRGFDGSTLDAAIVYYVEPLGVKFTTGEDGSQSAESTYYVFVKDSQNHIAKRITTIISGEELANCRDNNNCPKACENDKTCSVVVASKYAECGELEYNFYRSEFEPVDSNNVITAQKCKGMCYYADETDAYSDPQNTGVCPFVAQTPTTSTECEGDECEPETGDDDDSNDVDESEKVFKTSCISAIYKKKLFYKDRFNSNKACDSRSTYEQYDLENPPAGLSEEALKELKQQKVHYCSFVDCFKQNKDSSKGTYEVKAIGTIKRSLTLDTTYTYTDQATGESYQTQDYHIIYISSYDGKGDVITLNPTNNKMAPKAYEPENSIYRFPSADKFDSTPYEKYYVRVRD